MGQRADDDWNARVWRVRAKDGRQAPEPVSLTKIRRGVELGKLHVDMEIAQIDSDTWETISSVLSRHSPPRADESALFGALTPDVMTSVLATTVPSAAPHAPLPPIPSPPVRAQASPSAAPTPDPTPTGPTHAGPTRAGPTPTPARPALDMAWFDRVEKVARSALWLAIASACVIVPVAYVKHRRAEADLREELRGATERLAEAAKEKPPKAVPVLRVASMGRTISGLSKTEGHVVFTNASPRAGVLCLVGVATNPTTQATVTSLAACHEVGAYASAVHMTVLFPGREIEETCAKAPCTLAFNDAPQPAE
jgi:hypothetical protein